MATTQEKSRAASKIAALVLKVNPSLSPDCVEMKARAFVEQMVSILEHKTRG